MGYDVNRFQGAVDEELICPICSGVLENPIQAPNCEHAFCRDCINEWLARQSTCPVDRLSVSPEDLRPASRILRNLLCRLNIECDYSSFGCTSILKLDQLPNHSIGCDFNPEKLSPCGLGCGLTIPKDQLKDHNCVRDMRSMVVKLEEQLNLLTIQYREVRREVDKLKSCCRSIRSVNPDISAIVDSFEQDEVEQWVQSLPQAKIKRWPGIVSTPDSNSQEAVRKALIDSGCPIHLVTELMENSHERRWPPGLSTLEIRTRNRFTYNNFVCRKIPGRQAVVVMYCDNARMSPDMLLEPGLVMIFAYGVE